MTRLDQFLSRFDTDPKLRARIVHRRNEPAREAVHASLPNGIPDALGTVFEHDIYRHQREAWTTSLTDATSLSRLRPQAASHSASSFPFFHPRWPIGTRTPCSSSR